MLEIGINILHWKELTKIIFTNEKILLTRWGRRQEYVIPTLIQQHIRNLIQYVSSEEDTIDTGAWN